MRVKITMEQFIDEMVAAAIEDNQSQDWYVDLIPDEKAAHHEIALS